MLQRLSTTTKARARFLCLAASAIVAAFFTTPNSEAQQISGQRLTCSYKGYPSPFVLDASDFAALKKVQPDDYPGPEITPQYFASLRSDSVERKQICDTRGLWRAVKAGKATSDDFVSTFPRWIVDLFSTSERQEVVTYQIDMVAGAMSHAPIQP